ncbi:zinc finger BED domain-containing protein [Syngnathoides biaculeatus]|uniref:zinc finger BED domain-containing protein n=1 Tax=Syngnathoides biaculeatus TaxID=300417 RepID=UPI002ADE9508|nr:zinc finger BED domain-containing protein [Syngnathoides biaculeatus]
MTRKRSGVWDYFNDVCPDSVVCVLCRTSLFKHEQGSTTRMLRHLRTQHPNEAAAMAAKKQGRGTTVASGFGMQPMESSEAQVEVELEEGYSDLPAANEDDIDSAINGILVAVQGGEPVKETPKEALVAVVQEEPALSGKCHRRSLIWKHFEPLGSLNAAQCLICKKKIMCSEGKTSNLYRHMSKTHSQVNPQAGIAASEADSEMNSVVGADQGDRVGEKPEGKVMIENLLGSMSKCHRRSSIWKFFEPLGSWNVAQCLLCKKKMKCPDGKTSNLHRHMSKTHPQVHQRTGKAAKLTKPSSPSQSSSFLQETCPVELTDEGEMADVINVSKADLSERRIFKRERELIDALRRTQREEAKALEHQRELIESLRAVNAREAAAEKKQIESLRRTQQEEAKDLMRQREELETERAEQKKRWEELEQEKKQFFLLSNEPAAPALVSQE